MYSTSLHYTPWNPLRIDFSTLFGIVTPPSIISHALSPGFTVSSTVSNTRHLQILLPSLLKNSRTLDSRFSTFFINKISPMCSLQSRQTGKLSTLSRWRLVSILKSDIWNSWLRQYLRTQHERNRWIQPRPPLKKGDLVFIKDEVLKERIWPIARFLDTFPGDDGQVRAVRLLCHGKQYTRATQLLIPFCPDDQDTK